MRCIVCDKGLMDCFPDQNQPVGGTAFTTAGHYGSTVFDPMDGSRLEINVCDECLVKAAADAKVLRVRPSRRHDKAEVWKP